LRRELLVTVLLVVLAVAFLIYYYLPRPESNPFSLEIFPEDMDPVIVGQIPVFLVRFSEDVEDFMGGEVDLTATSSEAEVTVRPQSIKSGEVAEVTVLTENAETGDNLTISILGKREGFEREHSINFQVVEGVDELGPYAAEIIDRFIPWISSEYPEHNITLETVWKGTIVKPNFMVVMYYLFFSDEWEVGVTWHVTRPPDDWARIYLRNRFSETAPSQGFEIGSISEEDSEIQEVNVNDPRVTMDKIWR
jgi:hypothetical protein